MMADLSYVGIRRNFELRNNGNLITSYIMIQERVRNLLFCIPPTSLAVGFICSKQLGFHNFLDAIFKAVETLFIWEI